MDVFCGIDWAEDHHDIALVDAGGQLLARRRISDDAAGLAALTGLLAEHGDGAGDPVPVAIETPRGLLTACLRATGRPVYPINPMAVARYRDRHSVAGRKSDHGDAVVLANILRTDAHAHRPLPADSELAQAIAVLARAQQDAVWARTAAHNKLRSHLREYYPAFLAAFADLRGGITRSEARVILAAAPAPAAAARLTLAQLRALLRKASRRHGIDAEAARLREAFHAEQMRQLPLVEDAMGRQALALLHQLDAACAAAADLEQATIESFNQHPDAGIITSFPGLGPIAGARVLAETGDDRSRFADAKGLKAYAGAAPITRASGTPQPSATCSAASSAACTTAWPPASTTTKTPPSPTPLPHHKPLRLDNQTASDVFIASSDGGGLPGFSPSAGYPGPGRRRTLGKWISVRTHPALGRSTGAGTAPLQTLVAKASLGRIESRGVSDAPARSRALSGDYLTRGLPGRPGPLPCLKTSTRGAGPACRRWWRFRCIWTSRTPGRSKTSCYRSSTVAQLC
jgi:transposase